MVAWQRVAARRTKPKCSPRPGLAAAPHPWPKPLLPYLGPNALPGLGRRDVCPAHDVLIRSPACCPFPSLLKRWAAARRLGKKLLVGAMAARQRVAARRWGPVENVPAPDGELLSWFYSIFETLLRAVDMVLRKKEELLDLKGASVPRVDTVDTDGNDKFVESKSFGEALVEDERSIHHDYKDLGYNVANSNSSETNVNKDRYMNKSIQ
ncbi:hypothetical protein Droror1_Dr00015792 [Drosera rotundifolia]